ncbi:MAG: hypothetical protein L6R28_05380 [Planctomycetes bacterium]|nr:hypothetical protein [Planctomycetota bacterium]
MLAAQAPTAIVQASVPPNGNATFTVRLLTSDGNAKSARALLLELGFQADSKDPAPPPNQGARIFTQSLAGDQRAAFLQKVLAQRERLLVEGDAVRHRIHMACKPGLDEDPNGLRLSVSWKPGRLTYSGHPMDVAMPDAGTDSKLFLPIILKRAYAPLNLDAGAMAFVRAGRLYFDDDGFLGVPEGALAGDLGKLPKKTSRVLIQPDGRVRALVGDKSWKELGRLSLVFLKEARGDGRLFAGPDKWNDAAKRKPAEGDLGPLLVGHLEFPGTDAQDLSAQLSESIRQLRLLENLEAHAATVGGNGGGGTTPNNTPPEAAGERQLVIAANLPLAVTHLKALEVKVDNASGRTVIAFENNTDGTQKAVGSLSKVLLENLRKRMEICQQNYDNATRTRDERGQLAPYRRKLVQLGKAGEVVVAEDPSDFRKLLKPEHKDAGPEGFVLMPNVNRSIERADFERAAEEYRLLRAALARLAGDLIFPEPAAMQLDPKEP